eukprot:1356139-Amorphochlora_amoeboformis.AAC.1
MGDSGILEILGDSRDSWISIAPDSTGIVRSVRSLAPKFLSEQKSKATTTKISKKWRYEGNPIPSFQ